MSALAVLLSALNLCPGTVLETKITDPVQVVQYVPAQGFTLHKFSGGHYYVASDSVVVICDCSTGR
jgi:hypothetical protein